MTTGLIGTDRRPVPDELPASWGANRDQATDPAHAVLCLQPGIVPSPELVRLLPTCPPGPVGPPNREPWRAAQRTRSSTDCCHRNRWTCLICGWIAAAQHGQLASASYWTPLAIVAARTTAVDRTALARVLGDRGVWFVEQNPQWTRLAKGLGRTRRTACRSQSATER